MEGEAALNEPDKARGTVSMILSPPEASYFRVQGDLPVLACFPAWLVTTKAAPPGTDRGTTSDPDDLNEQRSELDSVASRSMSVPPLTGRQISSADMAPGTIAQTTTHLGATMENEPERHRYNRIQSRLTDHEQQSHWQQRQQHLGNLLLNYRARLRLRWARLLEQKKTLIT